MYYGWCWCRQWLKEHGDGVQETLDAIVGLSAHDNTNAAQAAFLLLRFSASTKVSHLLRMVPPPVMSTAAQRHDDAVASCLSLLLDKRRDPLQELVRVDSELPSSIWMALGHSALWTSAWC